MKVLFTLRFFCLGLYEFPCLVQSVQALAHSSHLAVQTNPLLFLLYFASAAEHWQMWHYWNVGGAFSTGITASELGKIFIHHLGL